MYLNHQVNPIYSQHLGSYSQYRDSPQQSYYPNQQQYYPNQQSYYPIQQSVPIQSQLISTQPLPRHNPPPPLVPSKQVYTPSVPVVSWHPLEARIQHRQDDNYNQRQQFEYNQTFGSPFRNQSSSQEKKRSIQETKQGSKFIEILKQKTKKASKQSTNQEINESKTTPQFQNNKWSDLIKRNKKLGKQGTLDFLQKEGNNEKQEYLDNDGQNDSDQFCEEDDQQEQEDEEEEQIGSDEFDLDQDSQSELESESDSEFEERQQIRKKYSLFVQGDDSHKNRNDGYNNQIRRRNNSGGGSNDDDDDYDYEGVAGLRINKISDKNRFETLYQYKKINKQHDNLFEQDFIQDYEMRDIFVDNKITIDQFNLSKNQKSVPSFIWNKTHNVMNNESIGEMEEYNRHKLWEVRYHKIGESDYLVSQFNNIFSRKSNYLKLGLFYKQAFIKYQHDRMKEIVYYLYSYDEYSMKKKKSELDQENNLEINLTAHSLTRLDEEYSQNYSQEQIRDDQKDYPNQTIVHGVTSKSKIINEADESKRKSIIFNNSSKSRVLNTSKIQSGSIQSKVLTITTVNKSEIKSQIKDNYDFAKSNFLRDYEKIHGGEQIQEDDDEQNEHMSKSYTSQQDKSSANGNTSDNYSKLYKSRPANQRKKVIETKDDDLSKIKSKHNKYTLWEKNAVSEDAFLDQVRDTTIEAVRRARNLEQVLVERNSIFEHHAASLLNQHLSQLRKVSRSYKQELYKKVKEIIQFIYDEYREVINFESNNTYVMIVCDKKDKDRILGIHYHGYQGQKYFEKYFDEFVSHQKTKKDFEEIRYQAFYLNKLEENICKRFFLQ